MLSRIRDTIVDVAERKHDPVFPGFKEMAERRRALTGELVARRVALGLSQTQVAARMRTSQSAVARLESGDADVRLSTLERYAAALGHELDWRLKGSKGERR
jgi:ribosome-binding protein aMBF1 (putative translation factor)